MSVYGIITASGEGRRMRALTNPYNRFARPKAMLPVGTRILVDYSIEALKGLGLNTIYVGMGPRPLSEILERKITDEDAYKVVVKSYAEEKVNLDTGGIVKYLLENYISPRRDDTVCVLPSDTFHNINLTPQV